MSKSTPLAFQKCFELATPDPLEPTFVLSLLFDPESWRVTGSGRILQERKPQEILTYLSGTYFELMVGPNGQVDIAVHLVGFPPELLNLGCNQPLAFENVQLTMVMPANSETGRAHYRYRSAPDAPWQAVNAEVAKIDCPKG